MMLRKLFLITSFFLLFLQLISISTVFAIQDPIKTGRYHFDPSATNDSIKFLTKKQEYQRTFFIDAEKGNDTSDGLSPDKAFKTLQKLDAVKFSFGDQILLKGGLIYPGSISLLNLNNSLPRNKKENRRIHIGSYGQRKAIIDCAGFKAGIWIENTSNVDITDLKITGNGGAEKKDIKQRYGIRILSSTAIDNSLVNAIFVYNVDKFSC